MATCVRGLHADASILGLRTSRCRTITLRSIERSPTAHVDLASSEVVLFSAENDAAAVPPASHLFSIPLPPDAPQCIHTAHSALEYTLTATLHPSEPGAASVSTTVVLHTRRYASHPDVLQPTPETQRLTVPTPLEVQVPRTTFRAGEPIPLYLTVPPPRRELVLDEGLRLRNVRAELVRVVRLHARDADARSASAAERTADAHAQSGPSSPAPAPKAGDDAPSSYALDMRPFVGTPGGGEVVALSGTSCRLHPTRALQIRLVLHPRQEDSPRAAPDGEALPGGAGAGEPEGGTACASVSQATVLHDVSFSVVVHATFMNMRTHTERVATLTIPVLVLPPTAPLPEVEESLATEYHKKHDRPPMRTVRQEDSDVPQYSEGEPGPSYSAAPPPFEEPDAPPPFFPAPAASGSRLPTFQESETEIYVPTEHDSTMAPPPPPPAELAFAGEGTLFGFAPADQFDGYPEHERALTPPPSMEMATRDPDVTSLATLDETSALNALELALEQHQDAGAAESAAPPPPPPMDDPSDPPPSIDSAFRSPNLHHAHGHAQAAPLLRTPSGPVVQPAAPPPDMAVSPGGTHEHAPPPYRVPGEHETEQDQEHVARPPPYVDLVPASDAGGTGN